MLSSSKLVMFAIYSLFKGQHKLYQNISGSLTLWAIGIEVNDHMPCDLVKFPERQLRTLIRMIVKARIADTQ